MNTLFLPDKITIEILDVDNYPILQKGVLIGIRTFANYDSDIDVSPFLTDKNGMISITADDIRKRADNFISYGEADYSTLESAKPEIEIYYWGKNSLEKHIKYWTKILSNKKDHTQFDMWAEQLGNLKNKFASIEANEKEALEVYSTAHNRKAGLLDDITLMEDTWDKPNAVLNYKLNVDL